MKKNIMVVLVGKRKTAAINVQKTLTAWGCLIKMRLGLHDGVLKNCSEKGLIICELVGDDAKIKELTRKLNIIKGVKAELVSLSID
ncbi:MAG TPA: hypothetical protein PK821_03940 [Victivallales bacterium]|nr:hypothetical protein [Victivallales bacterium]